MAEIPIERKSGSGWIIWLVLLALAALLAWWLFARGDDDVTAGTVVGDTAAVAPGMVPAPAAPATGDFVTDLTALTAADASTHVGRQVQLTSVPVESVVSDRGFWIGQDANQRVFAIRTNQNAPVTPPDGAVNAGQMVTVHGVVQAMPTNLEQQTTAWNLGSTDTSALAAQPIYVQVDSVTILQRP